MKLKPLLKDKDYWLKEFDHWVTPFIEEIRDSDIFHLTISNIKETIELLGKENNEFTTDDAASAKHITDAVMRGIQGKDPAVSFTLVNSFCDLLFLVTGKSDNNNKCQFPVHVKEVLKWNDFPVVRGNQVKKSNVPRVIRTENIAQLITQLESVKNKSTNGALAGLSLFEKIKEEMQKLLFHYFDFILNKDIYLRSLKVFGAKYFELRRIGSEDDLLAPIIIAYVRGSASASGGHKPEIILREHMFSWGLHPNEDYNTHDVKPFVNDKSNSDKTRAYDFVLPFNVKDWSPQIFIQSQFYAGDSGSVSHKNVDQTSNSRHSVKRNVKSQKFIEYVDGAGYYSSLNGDLRKLFEMSDTDNFFQVRTFPVKLRQILQEIGFLTPLELVHALCIYELNLQTAKDHLKRDGYSEEEIDRVIRKTEIHGVIHAVMNLPILEIESGFYILSRRYFLLDCIAIFGEELTKQEKGYALIPGYGEFYGAKISQVLESIKKIAGKYYTDWQNPTALSQDIEFLMENKWIVLNF